MTVPEFRYAKTFGSKFPWGDSLHWLSGEKPIYWVEGVKQLGVPLAAKSPRTYLIITSQRMVLALLADGDSGFVSNVNLEDILLIAPSGQQTIRLLEKGREPVELVGDESFNLDYVTRLTNEMVSRRRTEISAGLESAMRPSMDFSFMTRMLETASLASARLKCRVCNSLMDIPDSGSSIECMFCGTTLYAREFLTQLREGFR